MAKVSPRDIKEIAAALREVASLAEAGNIEEALSLFDQIGDLSDPLIAQERAKKIELTGERIESERFKRGSLAEKAAQTKQKFDAARKRRAMSAAGATRESVMQKAQQAGMPLGERVALAEQYATGNVPLEQLTELESKAAAAHKAEADAAAAKARDAEKRALGRIAKHERAAGRLLPRKGTMALLGGLIDPTTLSRKGAISRGSILKALGPRVPGLLGGGLTAMMLLDMLGIGREAIGSQLTGVGEQLETLAGGRTTQEVLDDMRLQAAEERGIAASMGTPGVLQLLQAVSGQGNLSAGEFYPSDAAPDILRAMSRG